MDSERFLEGLKAIRGKAALKRGVLDVADILASFPGEELNDDQIGLIYDYLEKENIRLADYEPHDVSSIGLNALARETWGAAADEREQYLFDMYQEEMAKIPPISTAEEEALCGKLLGGSPSEREEAARRLTEGNLRWVVQMARDQMSGEVAFSDLVQEGNLALWEGIQSYDGSQALEEHLEGTILKAMGELIRESGSYVKTENEMAAMANRILETVKSLEEELGREVTAREISQKTGIPESRVEEVLLESAKALKNAEKGAGT